MSTADTEDTQAFRIEHDSLGAVQVPREALYGAQTQRALDNFPISGLRMPRPFIRALGEIKAACAQVQGQRGGLESERATAIAEAARQVAAGDWDDHFPVDPFQTGSGTSSNMNANEVIAALASRRLEPPVHPNDEVNRAQSSNDVIPSCVHLSAALELQNALFPALHHLEQTLDAAMAAAGETVKTGRTHLMDAMPVTFAQEMSGWQQQLRHAEQRLAATELRLHRLALGGTAVGTGINASPGFAAAVCEQLSAATGIRFSPATNHFEALSCQDTALELSGQLRVLAVSLTKIANDLRWSNSGPHAGLGDIQLPQLQPGSSIMPGKINPVIPESVLMTASQVMGNDTAITQGAQNSHFQLNLALPLIAFNLLQSIALLSSACRTLADRALSGLTINAARAKEALDRNPILVTALNEHIGYEKGAEIAKSAYAENRPLLDVALQKTDLDRETLERLLDPIRLTRASA